MKHVFFFSIVFAALLSVFGDDKNLVSKINNIWKTHDANKILAYANEQATTNRNVETLFARGVVAVVLQKWCHGATNYFGQAIAIAKTNTSYTVSGRETVINVIEINNKFFNDMAVNAKEPINSTPELDANSINEVFNELGNEFPFLDLLEEIARQCSHEFLSRMIMPAIWTHARNEEVLFAYRVATPRQPLSRKKAFSTRCRNRYKYRSQAR